jgi:hypothetical protein
MFTEFGAGTTLTTCQTSKNKSVERSCANHEQISVAGIGADYFRKFVVIGYFFWRFSRQRIVIENACMHSDLTTSTRHLRYINLRLDLQQSSTPVQPIDFF